MRALAAAITLFLVTTPALAASPQVEDAIKVLQAVGADANRLKTFCEMMQIDEKMDEKEDPALKAQIDKLLDQVGADFKGRLEGCRRHRRKLARWQSTERGGGPA